MPRRAGPLLVFAHLPLLSGATQVVLQDQLLGLGHHLEATVYPSFSLGEDGEGIRSSGLVRDSVLVLAKFEDPGDRLVQDRVVLPLPMTMRVRLRKQLSDDFRLAFAESAGGRLVLAYNKRPRRSGVFQEQGGTSRKILELGSVARETPAGSPLAVQIMATKRKVLIRMAGRQFSFSPTTLLGEGLLDLRKGSGASRVLVDRVTVWRGAEDPRHVLLDADFHRSPLLLDLAGEMESPRDSTLFRLLAFLLLAASALLFEFLLGRILATLGVSAGRTPILLTLSLPTSLAVLLAVRGIFALPYLALAAVFAPLVLTRLVHN